MDARNDVKRGRGCYVEWRRFGSGLEDGPKFDESEEDAPSSSIWDACQEPGSNGPCRR